MELFHEENYDMTRKLHYIMLTKFYYIYGIVLYYLYINSFKIMLLNKSTFPFCLNVSL